MAANGNAPPGQLSGEAERTGEQGYHQASPSTLVKALKSKTDTNNNSSSKKTKFFGWLPFLRESSQEKSATFGGRWDPSPPSSPVTQQSFFNKHFTKPVEVNTGSVSGKSVAASDSGSERDQAVAAEKSAKNPRQQRKFSWTSRGCLVTLAIASLVLLAIIIAVAVVVTQHARSSRTSKYLNVGDGPVESPSSASDTRLAFSISQPPIRLGALTNFPDPSIYYDSTTHTWYAVASWEGCGILYGSDHGDHDDHDQPPPSRSHVQMATSKDFNFWQVLNYTQDPLQNPGSWVRISDDNGDEDYNHPHKHHDRSTDQPIYRDSTAYPDKKPHRRDSVPPGQKTPDELQAEVPNAAVWAPDFFRNPKTNKFVMYYSAAAQGYRHHCIGAASASAPQGPYEALPSPLACPVDQGGAIDPAPFVDPDTSNIYMAYKVDGNSIGNGGDCNNMKEPIKETPILLQRMQDDGLTIMPNSAPVTIMDRTPDDGPLVEAPSLVKVGKVYYLFFSSGCTRNHSYNLKYATADKVSGPYTRAAQPLISTGQYNLTAPGSATIRRGITTPGQTELSNDATKDWKIVLHSRVHMQSRGGVRALFTSGLEFNPTARTVRLVDGSSPT